MMEPGSILVTPLPTTGKLDYLGSEDAAASRIRRTSLPSR